ncbi:hypothetical protein PoB_002004800 [Plakobranchus ocellatus]|uniref:Uncharacterized protein n=1 Tax=Plakobranchus ocellatus TaxID=259542 RepID=A0AAV3ZFK0_9GAST|nr:hypothetical protein PoB_002004800 [Plakobranchus ocellatus]
MLQKSASSSQSAPTVLLAAPVSLSAVQPGGGSAVLQHGTVRPLSTETGVLGEEDVPGLCVTPEDEHHRQDENDHTCSKNRYLRRREGEKNKTNESESF